MAYQKKKNVTVKRKPQISIIVLSSMQQKQIHSLVTPVLAAMSHCGSADVLHTEPSVSAGEGGPVGRHDNEHHRSLLYR